MSAKDQVYYYLLADQSSAFFSYVSSSVPAYMCCKRRRSSRKRRQSKAQDGYYTSKSHMHPVLHSDLTQHSLLVHDNGTMATLSKKGLPPPSHMMTPQHHGVECAYSIRSGSGSGGSAGYGTGTIGSSGGTRPATRDNLRQVCGLLSDSQAALLEHNSTHCTPQHYNRPAKRMVRNGTYSSESTSSGNSNVPLPPPPRCAPPAHRSGMHSRCDEMSEENYATLYDYATSAECNARSTGE